jgi:hypothetical protein
MPMVDMRVNEALRETWNDLTAYMARRFTQEINNEKWAWPRDPSPRDIVDTGNLRKSLRVSQPADPKRLESEFTWKAPYAGVVHDGAVFKREDANGNPVTMPARPWTRPVLYDRARIQAYFRARFALAMRNRSAPTAEPGGGGQP